MGIFSFKTKQSQKHKLVIEAKFGWTKLWENYVTSIPLSLRANIIDADLRDNWKCRSIPADGFPTHLEFDSEEDLTAFVLRWS